MLFSHHNGLSQPVTDDSITQLQELACGIGPQIDGVIASVMQPQSMGAFATQGAASACTLRSQQSEQHQPTTTTGRSFGAALGADIMPTMKATVFPFPEIRFVHAAAVEAAQNQMGPVTPLPTTASYPAGTITAFNVPTNMWRVAVPTVVAGLGMFGAAAAFTEIAPVGAPPAGALQVSETQLLKQTGQLPLYKKWQFWAAVGGGLVVAGTGTALLFRRKR